MLYSLTGEFTQIAETTGTIQNSSHVGTIEMSTSDTPDSGILIYPLQKVSFSDQTIYLRCIDGYAEARVLPFVDGFSAGSSDSGDFDIRQYDSTGILIYYKDAAGTLHEKPVHYVNPNSTNAQLAALGKSIIAVTNNTYQSTYRVTKSLCEPRLIVDSPFTQDLTDNCGVVWNVTGTVTVSDGAAQFNKTYLRSAEPVTFGGTEFTISFYTYLSSSSHFDGGLFCAQPTTQTGNSNNAGRISFFRPQSTNNLALQLVNAAGFTTGNGVIVASNFLNARHHFELDYSHSNSTLKIFVDGQLTYTKSVEIERLARYFYLGCTGYDPNNQRMVGYISNFQVYDDGALHTEDFTPD